MMFVLEHQYSKKDLYRILNVPEDQQGGNWNTGYNQFKGGHYLFCNIGVPGRTGHDYDNYWDGNELIWSAKSGTKVTHPTIRLLLDGSSNVFIFTRTDSSNPFTYEGKGAVRSYEDTSPVKVRWGFKLEDYNTSEIAAEEISFNEPLVEGYSKPILVNKFERNREARRQCISHHGTLCNVCGFNFEEKYGESAKGFIHVHHLKQMSEVKEEYIINPIQDLIPVCANCHAIIHKRNPCYTIAEVRSMINEVEASALNKILG